MVLYLLQDGKFQYLTSIPVIGGVDLETFNIKGTTFLVAAEYNAGQNGQPLEGSVVYKFVDGDQILERVQTLNTEYPTDIVVWEDINQIFLAVAMSKINQNGNMVFEADSLIYRWLGQHFDLISAIKTYNAKSITPFKIGSTTYLAVANHENNRGETDIDSEIFKYALHDNRFVSYQKIRTHGAMDIKFFSFQNKRMMEYFIVVANMFEKGPFGKRNYEANSIIYKLADDYFVPFQSIQVHSAISCLPVKGDKGEFALFVASAYSGIKMFQYNGWRFLEASIQYTRGVFGEGISSMRSFKFEGDTLVSIANNKSDGSLINVFHLKFKYRNDLRKLHRNLGEWCNDRLSELDTIDLEDMEARLRAAPKLDDETVLINGSLHFESNVHVGSLLTESLKVPEGTLDSHLLKNLNEVSEGLYNAQDEIQRNIDLIDKSMKKNGTNLVQGSIIFKELNVNCTDCNFENVHIGFLNGENMEEFLLHSVHVDDGSAFSKLEFDELEVKGTLTAMFVNGRSFENLVFKSDDTVFTKAFTVYGNVTLDKEMTVKGFVNGVKFSENSLLLIEGNQTLPGRHLLLKSAFVGDFEVENLSNVSIDVLYDEVVTSEGKHTLSGNNMFHNLRADVVELGGLLSDVDVSKVDHLALKTHGDQEITGMYTFEDLTVQSAQIDGLLSGVKVPDDLVLIRDGHYAIDGNWTLEEDLIAKRIIVEHKLNHIDVHNGTLDVLLLNSSEHQTITGEKTVEAIHLSDTCVISGGINGLNISYGDAVAVIEGDLIIEGDVAILAEVSVQNEFESGDILDSTGELSIMRILDHGLRLDEAIIPIEMTMQGSVKIQNLNVSTINGVSPNNWLRRDSKFEWVTGKKIFADGFHLVNPADLEGTLNGVKLADFATDVLKVHGDQVITGHKTCENISTVSIDAAHVQFSDLVWNDILTTDGNKSIRAKTTILGPVTIWDKLSADHLNVSDTIGGINLNLLLEDLLFKDGTQTVKGKKHFEGNLVFKNLTVMGKVGSVDLFGLKQLLANQKDNYIEGNLIFTKPVQVESFSYEGTMDGISHKDFGSAWLLTEGDQTISEHVTLHNVSAEAGIVLTSGLLNDENFKNKMDGLVRTTDDASFTYVQFDGDVTSLGPVTVEGTVGGIDLSEEAITLDSSEEQAISETKYIKELIVEGNVHVKGDISGVDTDELCSFISSQEKEGFANLTIKGSVFFKEEPEVLNSLNNVNLDELKKNIWLADKEVVLSGEVRGNILNFQNEVNVEGLVDNVDLQELWENYFSKSREDTILGSFDFGGGVTFGKSVHANKANVGGLVNGVNLTAFERRVLLNGIPQNIYSEHSFEELYTGGHFTVKGLINDIDIANDVMRYDASLNKVTARKVIYAVMTRDLTVTSGTKIQDVDIPYWNKFALKKEGDFTVKGKKKFTSLALGDMRVEGLVNDLVFDKEHIMLRSEPQVVSGKKTFMGYSPDRTSLLIERLNIEGFLNDVDIMDLLRRLAYKNRDLVFSAPKTFSSPLSADNIIALGLYYGLNISNLPEQSESPLQINDLQKEYQNLLGKMILVGKSLSSKAYYVTQYKLLQTIKKHHIEVFAPIYLNDNFSGRVAVIQGSTSQYGLISFLNWDSELQIFVEEAQPQVKIKNPIFGIFFKTYRMYHNYLFVLTRIENEINEKVRVGRRSYRNAPAYSTVGYFFLFNKKGIPETVHSIFNNGSTSAVPFVLPDTLETCILLTRVVGSFSDIFCEKLVPFYGTGIGMEEFYLYQQIETHYPVQAVAGIAGSMLYLAVANAEAYPQEAIVDLWKYNNVSRKFEFHQSIEVPNPIGVSSISFEGRHYVAIVSGYIKGTPYGGCVEIHRFDFGSGYFQHWITLHPATPTSVQFAILPSQQLVLYVVTNNPAKPFIVYQDAGVEGFKELTHAAGLITGHRMSTFTDSFARHFVAVSGPKETKIIEALFKGRRPQM